MRLVYDDYNWRIRGGCAGCIGTVSRTWSHAAFTNGYKLIEVFWYE